MGGTPEEALIGHDYTEEYHDLMASISPVTYIDPKDPPVIIFHGKVDNVVPCCQGSELFEKLHEAGVRTEIHLQDNGGHGINMYTEENLQNMVKFLDSVRTRK